MKYIVIENRVSAYPNPIKLTKDEDVIVGNVYCDNNNWTNWVKCTNKFGVSGWVPKSIIDINNNLGHVLENYSANELNISVNDEIRVIKIINGWAWSRNSSNELGWVPLEYIRLIV